MKLVITPRFISTIGVPHWVKGIHFPTKIISTSSSRLKHIFHCSVIFAGKKFKFHFKPVKEKCHDEDNNLTFYYGFLTLIYSLNCHPKRNQYECMTPNESKNFQNSIKSMLKFMNGRNLHRILVFFLHVLSIPTKFLKSHVFLIKYVNLSRCCDN